MAFTLAQGEQFRLDAGYRARVYSGMTRHAATVMAEALNAGGQNPGTTGAKRKQLANRVLVSPSAWIDPFMAVIAADPGASLAWFPLINIASSTNANPSVVTTAVAHGIAVGDVVEIQNHLVNTAINGVWTIATVGSATTLTVPTAANGVGGATGQTMKMETDININFTLQNQWNNMANTGAWDV
jgi:hypothetical protein